MTFEEVKLETIEWKDAGLTRRLYSRNWDDTESWSIIVESKLDGEPVAGVGTLVRNPDGTEEIFGPEPGESFEIGQQDVDDLMSWWEED